MKLLSKRRAYRFLGLYYPPYLGAGVRVLHVAPDFSSLEVEMKLRWWNRNYLGTHFGGSLYSMCDPFYVLLLAERLGSDYLVWDKKATIHFRRPGRGRVRARFELPDERVEEIRQTADDGKSCEPTFTVQVLADDDSVIAEVEKLLWVARKRRRSKES